MVAVGVARAGQLGVKLDGPDRKIREPQRLEGSALAGGEVGHARREAEGSILVAHLDIESIGELAEERVVVPRHEVDWEGELAELLIDEVPPLLGGAEDDVTEEHAEVDASLGEEA